MKRKGEGYRATRPGPTHPTATGHDVLALTRQALHLADANLTLLPVNNLH